ncbi:MAG: aldo/keto reductase [Elainellaceae cyanobacterium]
MEYRNLGKTQLKVSAFAMGTYQLSGALCIDGKADGFPDIGYEEAVRLIHFCEDQGINVVDSAEIYGAGEGERRVGSALKGRRDRWIISTKFGWRVGEQGNRITDSHSSTIRTSLEGSLRRLNTDYVDIYLYHTPPHIEDIEKGISVLESLKQEGKIRFYGISTDSPIVLSSLLDRGNIDVVQFEQSLLKKPRKMLELSIKNNLGIMGRGALSSGMLSGKYFHNKPQLSHEDIRKDWFDSTNLNQFSTYERLVPPDCSMVMLALRYLLDINTSHTIVLGGKSTSNYKESLQALEIPPLSPSLHKQLANISRLFYLKRAMTSVRYKGQKLLKKLI